MLQLHQRSLGLAKAVNASEVEDVREHLPFTILTELDLPPDSQVPHMQVMLVAVCLVCCSNRQHESSLAT